MVVLVRVQQPQTNNQENHEEYTPNSHKICHTPSPKPTKNGQQTKFYRKRTRTTIFE